MINFSNEKRCEILGEYIMTHGATVRDAARFFGISKSGSTVKTEIIAGLTTFFAMAYIIVVNPNQVVGFSF